MLRPQEYPAGECPCLSGISPAAVRTNWNEQRTRSVKAASLEDYRKGTTVIVGGPGPGRGPVSVLII